MVPSKKILRTASQFCFHAKSDVSGNNAPLSRLFQQEALFAAFSQGWTKKYGLLQTRKANQSKTQCLGPHTHFFFRAQFFPISGAVSLQSQPAVTGMVFPLG